MVDISNTEIQTDKPAIKGRSLWDDAWARLRQNPAAMVSLFILGFLCVLAAFGPMLWVHSVEEQFRDRVLGAPTLEGMHWFGTDAQGRDQVARILFGLRMSILVGIVTTLVAMIIGVLWGAIAGFVGGVVDQVMMRIVDVIYTVPFIFFVILLVTVIKTESPITNILLIFVAIGAVEWLTMARIVRGQTLSLRRKEFIEAAEASGVTSWDIVTRHIVPNVLGPVIVYATLLVPTVILTESTLSFLGLGVQEPLTSLGVLISRGAEEMEIAWWLIAFPAATMTLLLLSLNFLGDGLRDALDPKDR
jgi:oligopeptide transport system permease protein